MRSDDRKTINTYNVRRLKIQPKIRVNKYNEKKVPELKLCGNWLQNLGFLSGANVTITGMPNLLIIRTAEE